MFANISIMKGARIAVETCMKVKLDETVLVVTDTPKLQIAEAFAYAATSVGANTVVTVMVGYLQNLAEART